MRRAEGARHLAAMAAAADKAAALQMRYYGKLKKGQVAEKTRNDFVTVIDRRSQDILIDSLKRSFPSYGFKAEEKGVHERKERTWIIDPLDGTSNYIHQFPLFCISIGLVEAGKYIAGLVMDPLHRETFTALKGGGAYLNGRRISVSSVSRIQDAFIATGFPYRMREFFEPYHRSLRKIFYMSSGIRRGGSAALDLCYTACGRVDGFWEFGLSEWDLAAGSLIVEEAGGAVSDFKGLERYMLSGNIVAGNKRIHAAIVKVLKGIRGFRDFKPTRV